MEVSPTPPAVIRVLDGMETDRRFGLLAYAMPIDDRRRKRTRVCTGCRRPKYQAATVRCGCSPAR